MTWIVSRVHNVALGLLPEEVLVAVDNMMTLPMPSVRSLTRLAFAGAQAVLGYGSGVHAGSPAFCSNPQLSCQNTTAADNLCCFNAPGGQLLQTQFWDTSPSTGPVDSWTIHGLWPDHCDGTFDATCDSSRQYTGIDNILTSYGKTDVLQYMQTYWKDYQGNDESFWEHEWGKHGTCISTLNPSCYTNYQTAQEVPDFFNKTVQLFKSLPSFDWLTAAGITPSTTQTYSSSAIQAALSKNRGGHQVTLGCKNGVLNEIWYHFNVRGSVQDGVFVAADPDGTKSTCPATGIQYLPKSGSGGGSPPSTTTTTGSPPSGTGTPFSGKGYLNVSTGGAKKGCIISGGTWYTSGTCATFTAASSGSSGGFTLSSSKGKCGIVSGTLSCGSGVSSATVFTASGGSLVNGGSTTFYADSVPSGSTQVSVYTDEDDVELSISWQSV